MSRHIMLAVFALVFGTAQAQAYLDIYPRSINFTSTYVGDISFTETIYVTNYYNIPLDLRVYNNCFADFRIDDFDCRYPVGPGGRCNIRVQFWPATPGSKWCSIDIDSLHGGFHRIDVRGDALLRP
jgi:hypothetical protein